MSKAALTAARARELLDYDAATGEFRWRFSRSGVSAGPAGSVNGPGYVYLCIDGQKHLAHRIAWLIMTGSWPLNDVDHINCDMLDNRWENLRDVERYINNQNRAGTRCDNRSSGLTGVTWHAHSKKWRARITLQGKEHRLGLYESTDDAYQAYLSAKRQLHAGCTI